VPEGDTIHRTAASLRLGIGGEVLRAFEAPRLTPPFPAEGETVGPIEARGKHLLVRFSGGLVLHTHMRMTGSWHQYRPGAPWRRPRRSARVVLRTNPAVAVCFDAPVVALLDEPAVARHPVLRRLGPDLCVPGVDIDLALDRMSRIPEPDATIAEVLLDQRVAAGIGNVYASEVCHLGGIHPRTPLARVDAGTRRVLLTTAARLLQANLDLPYRTTVAGAEPGTLHVYGRDGEPCRRCRTPLVAERVGADARITTWCPRCQPAPWE
jgi:endonuclease-8